jgi:hypothetical protein
MRKMNTEKKENKIKQKKQKREIKRRKKNALIRCQDGKSYWTTQDQFWQWAREKIVRKTGDYPLQGEFTRPDVEKEVIICNTVLSLACPNHLHEAIYSRKFRHL